MCVAVCDVFILIIISCFSKEQPPGCGCATSTYCAYCKGQACNVCCIIDSDVLFMFL